MAQILQRPIAAAVFNYISNCNNSNCNNSDNSENNSENNNTNNNNNNNNNNNTYNNNNYNNSINSNNNNMNDTSIITVTNDRLAKLQDDVYSLIEKNIKVKVILNTKTETEDSESQHGHSSCTTSTNIPSLKPPIPEHGLSGTLSDTKLDNAPSFTDASQSDSYSHSMLSRRGRMRKAKELKLPLFILSHEQFFSSSFWGPKEFNAWYKRDGFQRPIHS